MCQLNSRECDRRGFERLQPQHGSAAAFDRAVVLFDDIVEIPAEANGDRLPPWIFIAQQPQRPMTRGIAVQVHGSRPLKSIGRYGVAKELLGGILISTGTKQRSN